MKTLDESNRAMLLDTVERYHAEQTVFLAELVKVPSDNPPGNCDPIARRAAQLLTDIGYSVEHHPVPANLTKSNGMVSATNLVVRRNFGPGPVVALNAHGDVVPPGENWTVDPYGADIKNGRMYGRGVAVSKSDFATYSFALKALEDSGVPLAGTVELHFTFDEETGGVIGPGWLIEKNLTNPDYVISAGFTYNVVIAHNGCLHLEISVHGRSAHAARPDTGVDALEAATQLLMALYGLRSGLKKRRSTVLGIDHPTLVVGLIQGGINTNVVPDLVVIRLDRRIIPEESPEEVEQELRSFIANTIAGLPGIEVDVRQVLLARPLLPQKDAGRLIESLQRNARVVTGEAIPANGVPLYTDARHYSAAGIPTVLYGAGPHSLLEANGHRADENLVLSDLLKATKVIALTLAELLGRAE